MGYCLFCPHYLISNIETNGTRDFVEQNTTISVDLTTFFFPDTAYKTQTSALFCLNNRIYTMLSWLTEHIYDHNHIAYNPQTPQMYQYCCNLNKTYKIGLTHKNEKIEIKTLVCNVSSLSLGLIVISLGAVIKNLYVMLT